MLELKIKRGDLFFQFFIQCFYFCFYFCIKCSKIIITHITLENV